MTPPDAEGPTGEPLSDAAEPADPYAGKTAAELVEALAAEPGWPPPALLEAILACGPEAVPPLVARLHEEYAGDEDGQTAASWAVNLLGSLRDPSALPAMLKWLQWADPDYLEGSKDSLGAFGPDSLDLLLPAAVDPSLPEPSRSYARDAAVAAAGDDPAARARVAGPLRDRLAELIALGDKLEGELYEELAFLVCDLADLADPQAKPLIDAAFDADLVDGFIVDRKFIDDEYESGGEFHEADPDGWRVDYPDRYREHLEFQERGPSSQSPQSRSLSDDFLGELAPPPPSPAPEPIRNTGPRLGRNDPCWCGSGKKYKTCHWKADQA